MKGEKRVVNDAPSTRERLIGFATDIFLRDGYDATLDAVAAAAGVTRQTVYNIFGSKAGFFHAVFDQLVAESVPDLLDFEIRNDLRGSLVRLGDKFLNLLLSEHALQTHRIFCSRRSHFEGMQRIVYERSARPLHSRFRDYLRAQMRQGRLIVADYDLAAEQFLGSLLGQVHMRAIYGLDVDTPRQLKRRCRAAVDSFLRSYEPRTGGARKRR